MCKKQKFPLFSGLLIISAKLKKNFYLKANSKYEDEGLFPHEFNFYT